MALREIHSWTLGGLVGAFIDLVLAYFLLCGSAVAFFASKFLMLFGLYLPCPCKGVLGYKNGDFCLHKVLYDWPLRKICSIQVMAVKRFPYDLVRVKDHTCTLNEKITAQKKSANELRDLEDEASCSSWSSPHLLASTDRENGYDTKGKRTVNLRKRSGIRRRRKGNYECGKFFSVFPSENPRSDVTRVSSLPYEGDAIGSKTTETNPTSGREVSLLDAHMDHDMEERTCRSYEFRGSLVDSPPRDKSSSSTEIYMSNGQDKVQVVESGESRIKMLEAALEEEKAAYAALCLELEKERSAAATAADEAMAMISRLQEEKAFIEIETRQYQRMIEERVAYEEEEMNILQEILIRRERENHFLEKELETYRQMNLRVIEQPNGKSNFQLDDLGQKISFSVETHESPLQTDSSISMAKIAHLQSNHTVDQTCIKINDEEIKKSRQLKDQYHGTLLSSCLDTEPDVLDVHVIDDNVELKKEEVQKTNGVSFNTASDEPRDNLTSGSLEVLNSIAVSDFPMASKAESDDGADANIDEKLKIGSEIEMLGERLRMLKHEKEKLTFFSENEESKKVQLKLLEEIANHLQEIKQLRNPVRGSSLPPSSAKVSLKKRRSQSAIWKTCESS
ncbi:probable myosin-binding protein 6 isoform X2 [Neltuma alba]|uniref:probable myosin-binding protein 6 isoform X2 n=1 Tax=Neltuma alba TaxID=207710 RepID=UPI0010A2E850|nr:probable myosin-binding protein 6 isoform X2 [Prosopis alba]